jgi:flagellar biosynthesis GTPase FlhF
MIAEQQRRAEEEKKRAEEEKRRIEEERRRAEKEQKLAEDLRRLEEDNKRRAAERQKRQEEKLAREQYERQRQQDRERGRQRDSPERLREMFEEALREERHRMDQEWERLADNFIPPPTASRPRTPNRHAATPRQNDAERFREAWDTYERRWTSLLSSTTLMVDSGTQNGLRFSDIPWPVMRQPRNGGDLSTHLTKALISTFVLSPYRLAESSSTDLSDPRRLKKSRLREAMLRWHPDKFAKASHLPRVIPIPSDAPPPLAQILARVTSEEDKKNIREGSEQVVRILNTLMASQTTL